MILQQAKSERATVTDLPMPVDIDGAKVSFEPVTPAAKPMMQAAMATLSEASSRNRFFTVRHELSDHELDHLTTLDGWNRFAIGAVARYPDGRMEGVGVARFERFADRPAIAEAALIVVDGWQRRGIGIRLWNALTTAAVERGIHTLRCIVLPDNAPMIELLTRHSAGMSRTDSTDHLIIDVHLDRRRAVAETV